ncbi:MAG TPA: PEP-CTERM sorting domain-containing protein [Chthoniobacterales bacterium]|nr:PEP-CTERM sorting domain-containing protein [Chthoniobacterales bacterium]
MKLKRGIWRPVRWLLLLVTTGAVLAADNTWIAKLRFDFTNPTAWLDNFYPATRPELATVAAPEPVTAQAQPGIAQFWNTLLFSPPSSGWTLDTVKATTTSLTSSAMQTTGGSVTVAGATSNRATATFSSGFVATTPSRSDPAPGLVPLAPTASGTWSANASGNWSNSANWSGGVIADGVGSSARFDMTNITTDVTVTLDSSRSIGRVSIGDTDGTHHYTIAPSGGSTLTFDGVSNNAAIVQTATSAGDIISVPILTKSSLEITNDSATNPLAISGSIQGTGGANFLTVYFAGKINASGDISNGATGATISTQVTSGTVTFTGTNSYSGITEIDGGALLVNGDNSAAKGIVYVYNGGTLGGTGTIGGDVYTFGGTITGGTSTTVGSLTLTGDVNINTGEGSGAYLANLSGSFSDLLAITGEFRLGGESALQIVGAADGVTTYTLATFASHDGIFNPAMVTGIPTGYDLVYHDTDLQLVPIPEPATWIGAGLAAGAIAFARRTRKSRK